jgi:organic radical activating enzyme
MVFKYAHPEWFESIDNPKLSAQDTIILWGAGKLGSVVAHALKKQGLTIEAFVDSAKDKQGTFFCEKPVISPQKLENQYPEAIIIVSCGFPYVYNELKEKRKYVYDPHSFLLEVDLEGYEGEITLGFACRIIDCALRNYALYYGNGILIERLFFLITNKCTLNCLNCDAYIPYHTEAQTDEFDLIVKSYEKIMDACGYVEIVNLLGGEPLLHPDITKITRYFVNDNRCGQVVIISNGTIMPSAELVEVLKSPRCALRISDYGGLSRRKEEIIELCRKEHIRLEVTNYQFWDKLPLIQDTKDSLEQLDKKYDSCITNTLYIKRGKVFQCAYTAGLSGLSEQILPDFESNYIDIHEDSKDVVSEIQKFAQQIHNRTHLNACRYCLGSHYIRYDEDKQPVAEQAKGKLPLELLFKDGVRLCD